MRRETKAAQLAPIDAMPALVDKAVIVAGIDGPRIQSPEPR